VIVVNVLRGSPARPLDAEVINGCLDLEKEADRDFHTAWTMGIATISRGPRKARLLPVLGHIAESVAEVMLHELGHDIVWHQTGAGVQGVDLLTLTPSGSRLLAVEVKGTLRRGHIPRLSTGSTVQMSAEWLERVRNAGMLEWQLGAEDVYGAVFGLNFADMVFRAAVTDDFLSYRPVHDLQQLAT